MAGLETSGVLNLDRCETCDKWCLAGETVMISVAEYERLTRIAEEAKARRSISKYRTVSNTAISLNPKLADFILEKYETMRVKDVHAACVERFGESAPSRASIYRFISSVSRAR